MPDEDAEAHSKDAACPRSGAKQKPDLSKNWGNLGTSLRAEQAN